MIDYRIDSHKLDLHPERVAAWLRGEKIYPLYLEIAPSGGCNHRCTFCAVDYLGYETRFLDADIMKDRLAEMGRLGVKSIMWAGEGEPTLHRRLGEMICAGHYAGIDQAITTNGLALTERLCNQALPALAWIKTSINAGFEDDYTRIHRAPKGDWLKLWVNMARAVRIRETVGSPVTLGAQMVLLPDNVNGARPLAYMALETGLDYLVFKAYSQHPKSETRQYAGLRYNEYDDLLAELEGLSTDTFQVIARREAMHAVTATDRGYDKCRATPEWWAYVMSTGDVYSCSAYLGDERFKLGNLLTQTFRELWDSERRSCHATFVREELDISQCRLACRMHGANKFLDRVIAGPNLTIISHDGG